MTMKTKAAIIFWAWTWLAPVCAGSLHAQSIPVNTKMGKVSVEECAMDSFPPDTSASALVLYEDHSLKIDYNLSLGIPIQRTTHRERIKILKEDAMDYCDYSMMISRDSDDMESISSISVVTYNLEGGKVVATKMPRSNIFWTKYNDHFDKVSFAAQNVRVGSVVEVYYDMDTGRVMNIDDFYFQRSIPVNLCVYTVTLPRWLEFKRIIRGDIPLSFKENIAHGVDLGTFFPDNSLDVTEYTAVDIPALDQESGLYCPRLYRSSLSIDVSGVRLMTNFRDFSVTWDDVDKQVCESSIMTQIKANCRFKDEVDAAIAGKESAQDKLAAIIELVRGKVEWDRTYRLVPTVDPDPLRSRSGSSADINVLVASAARYAGFRVAPVLICSRTNGMVLDYHPSTSAFNKLILRFDQPDGEPLYVDAADPDGWFNVLNDNDLVAKARVISENGIGEWADLTALSRNVSIFNVDARLSPDGTLEGDCTVNYVGCPSRDFKKAYRNADQEEDLVDRLEKEYSVSVEDFSASQIGEFGPSSSIRFHFEKSCDSAGETIYVNPFLEKFQSETLFRSEERKYPVDFPYPEQIVYTFRLTLPEGYTVDQLPERVRLVSALPSTAVVATGVSGDVVQLSFRFDLGTLICLPLNYAGAREYWSALCGIYEQMIVVKKS